MARPQKREESFLEGAHPVHRKRIEIAIDPSINHANLFSTFKGENCACFKSSVKREPRASKRCVVASRSEPNCAKAAISRYWASSPLICPRPFSSP